MKTNSFRQIVATALLLAGLAGASSAQAAAPQVVFEDLGAAAAATDVYSLICPFGTTGVSGNVTDLVAVIPPLVSLQIFKPLSFVPPFAINTTDPVDGFQFVPGAGFVQVPSPTVTLNQGFGQYYLLVDKTGAGVENYRMSVHCNGGFFHFTPVPVLIQDQ